MIIDQERVPQKPWTALQALLGLTNAFPRTQGILTVPLDDFAQLVRDFKEFAPYPASHLPRDVEQLRIRNVTVRPDL